MFLDVFLKANKNIKDLITHTIPGITESDVDLLFNSEQVNSDPRILQPTLLRLQDIRAELGENITLNRQLFNINNRWTFLFSNAMNHNIPPFVRGLLISPLQAALTNAGKDDTLWQNDVVTLNKRRIMNFYRQYKPAIYAEILTNMIKLIRQHELNSINPTR